MSGFLTELEVECELHALDGTTSVFVGFVVTLLFSS